VTNYQIKDMYDFHRIINDAKKKYDKLVKEDPSIAVFEKWWRDQYRFPKHD
jgi:hypothetical protein